jgi:hypothetical protein
MANMSEEEIKQKEASLITAIENTLPAFAKSCREKADVVILHQDAFATDYQEREYMILGMAIKFAGLYGRQVQIIGKNRETLAKQ